jgi:hypothetical protein
MVIIRWVLQVTIDLDSVISYFLDFTLKTQEKFELFIQTFYYFFQYFYLDN